MTDQLSLQERLAPDSRCFGCGPANLRGLRIRSFPMPDASGTQLVCEWQPEEHHMAAEGMLNGGIVGTLLDCHSNWTALWHLRSRDQRHDLPCTVTGDFHVELKAPTPTDRPLQLYSRVVEASARRVTVEARIEADGAVTATCLGHFIEVRPGHPAYRRW